MLVRSKGGAQRLSAFLSRLLPFLSKRLQAEEPVNHTVIAGESDGHTRLFEPLAVGFALVAQWVILGCNHQGRWQPAQVGRLHRRRQRVLFVGIAVQIVAREPVHIIGGQEVALTIFVDGWAIEGEIRRRVDQQLESQPGATLVPRHLRHHRRKVAAGAIAAYGKLARVGVELCRMSGHPLRRGVAIFGCSGEFVFGCEAVVHRHHDAAGSIAQAAAQAIMRVQIAYHPAGPGIVLFTTRATGSGSPGAFANCIFILMRTSSGVSVWIGGPLRAAIWSRRACTCGSSGMRVSPFLHCKKPSVVVCAAQCEHFLKYTIKLVGLRERLCVPESVLLSWQGVLPYPELMLIHFSTPLTILPYNIHIYLQASFVTHLKRPPIHFAPGQHHTMEQHCYYKL